MNARACWHTGGQDGRIVYDGNGRAVCDCTVHYADGDLSVMQANATLVAASPDMLAVLHAVEWGGQRAWADCDGHRGSIPACPACYGMDPSHVGSDRFNCVGHRANCCLAAAIVKAEGKTS